MLRLAPFLPALAARVRETCDTVDTSVDECMSRLTSASFQATTAAQTLRGTLEEDGSVGDNLSACRDLLSELGGRFGDVAQSVRKDAQDLENSRNTLEQSTQLIEHMNDVVAEARILAINGRIEARHAGEHGKGFGVVAAGLEELAQRSRAVANDLREMTEALDSTIRDAIAKFERLADNSEAQSEATTERVDDALTNIEVSKASLETAVLGVSVNADGVAEAINEANKTLQFQDIASQQLKASATCLDAILEHIDRAYGTDAIADALTDVPCEVLETLEGFLDYELNRHAHIEPVAEGDVELF